MGKKKVGALVEIQADNPEQEELVTLLRQFDDLGVSLVEEQWRRFSPSEQNIARTWVAGRLNDQKLVLPLFLGEFASIELARELDAHLAEQRKFREVLAPCVFAKPGFGQAADGESTVCLKVKIPDRSLGDRSALELWGKTRCEIAFSRRAPHEWSQGNTNSAEWDKLISEGPMRIIACEADIMAFGWRDENWTVSFLVPEDIISLDEARADWNKQGSIMFTVIGKANKGATAGEDDDSDEEDAAPVAPNVKKAAAPKTKVLPGVEPEESNFSVGFTDDYMLDLRTIQTASGSWQARWEGVGPSGKASAPEPSVRASEIEAASATLGRANDVWAAWAEDDEQAKRILGSIKHWLAALSSGRAPAAIEADE